MITKKIGPGMVLWLITATSLVAAAVIGVALPVDRVDTNNPKEPDLEPDLLKTDPEGNLIFIASQIRERTILLHAINEETLEEGQQLIIEFCGSAGVKQSWESYGLFTRELELEKANPGCLERRG